MAQQPKDPAWADPLPPATEQEIAAAEHSLDRVFPDLLRQLLLCSSAWQWREPAFDAVLLIAPEDIVRETRLPVLEAARIEVGESCTPAVKAYFYSAQRLVFAYSDYHRFLIDDDPGPGGHVGQIVVVNHDEQTIDLVAKALSEFIAHGLDCLERQLRGGFPNDA